MSTKTPAESEFPGKIRRYLDIGTRDLGADTARRLASARQRALSRMTEVAREPDRTLALSGAAGRSAGGHRDRGLLASARFWLVVLVAVVGSVTYVRHWQDQQTVRELTEIDAALLSADLPLDALLDKGFINWLKRGEQF